MHFLVKWRILAAKTIRKFQLRLFAQEIEKSFDGFASFFWVLILLVFLLLLAFMCIDASVRLTHNKYPHTHDNIFYSR